MEEIVYKCECKCCNNESLVDEDKLLPGREFGYCEDEFLTFYVQCPICHHLNKINMRQIPTDVKIKVMKKYAGIADLSYSLIELKAKAIEIDEEIKEITNKIEKIKNSPDRDITILFPKKNMIARTIDSIVLDDYVNEDPKQFIKRKK